MNYIKPKYIDFNISRLGLGTWQASGGDSWSGHSDEQLIQTYRYALDNGINFIDTAPVYGYGKSEQLVGEVVKAFGRTKVFVATKCGLPWNGKKIRNDVSKQSILKECEESLIRLKSDYIDLYQIHWPTFNNVPIEETIDAMATLQKSGKIRYIGVCNHSLADTKKWFDSGLLSSYQGLYNYLDRNASEFHGTKLQYRTESEILPFVKQTDVAFFPYCPLAQGFLSGRYNEIANLSKYDVRLSNTLFKNAKKGIFPEITQMTKQDLLELAFSFLISKQEITSVIAGVSSVEQVQQNIATVEKILNN